MKTQIIEIRTGSIGLKKKISVIQEDTARQLRCILSDFIIPDGSTARIYAVKPSGNKIYNDGVIEGNTVLVDLTTQLIAEIGEVACQVEITESNGNVLTSFEFVIEVKKRLKDASAIESTNEFTALEAALGKVQNIDTKVSKNTNDISELKTTDNVLSSRIDMLSSLKEGSTTADAELLDIRVKADGSLATSAGNAVREQFDELKGDLDNKADYKYPNVKEYVGYLNASGDIYHDNNYHSYITDFVNVNKGDTFYYKGIANDAVVSVLMYDSDKNILENKKITSLYKYTEIIIDIDCSYARFCSYAPINDSIVFSLCKKGYSTSEYIESNLAETNEKLAETNEKLAETNEKLAETNSKVENTTVPFDGFYKNESPMKDGSFSTHQGWFRSKYILCAGNKKIHFEAPCHSIGIVPVAFYDENKNFISAINPNLNNESGYSGDTVTPSNTKYIIVSSYNFNDVRTEGSFYYIAEYNLEDIQNNKDHIIELEKNNFSTILCIGDSLTEGDYGSEPAGTMNVHSENYPYYMSKLLKCNVVNKGRCGFTPISYWNSMIKTIDFSTISPKIIVIMLGTNGTMTDTLDTDVEPYDNYENYADTGTGDYCKIIEYVNEQTNGECQIVLCTCPFVDSTRRNGYANNVKNANVVIPKIANKYNLPLIDVNKELGLSSINTNVLQPIDGLHFGQIGYSRLGTFIGSKLKSIHSFVYTE